MSGVAILSAALIASAGCAGDQEKVLSVKDALMGTQS